MYASGRILNTVMRSTTKANPGFVDHVRRSDTASPERRRFYRVWRWKESMAPRGRPSTSSADEEDPW